MSDRLDDLLKSALAPSEEPSAILNQKILQKAKGEKVMRKPFFKTAPVLTAIAIAFLATGSLTAYAAWQYLSTSQVAERVEDKKLADAFKGEDAIRINESQVYGDYRITLMGAISGKNLSDYTSEVNGKILDNVTYMVVSIAKTDGTAIPQMNDEDYDLKFLVSPFIKGENPVSMNIFYMGGGYQAFVEDGIEYRLVNCDSLEAFAERGVYLGVLSETFYNNKAYNFNEETGEVTRNEEYEGVNALFDLPLDKSKADEKAAEEQLTKWRENAEQDTEDELIEEHAEEWHNWSPEKIKKECTIVPNSKNKYPASKYDEMITVEYEYGEESDNQQFRPSGFFKKNEYGFKRVITSSSDDGAVLFTLCERKKDGTLIVSIYRMDSEVNLETK